MRKLLIFSCCIMIAAFAALWVSCKNSIPLVAEEPDVGVTQPTLTISKTDQRSVNSIEEIYVEATEEIFPESVSDTK